MASDISMIFAYGDSVELVDASAVERFGVRKGSVCGFRLIDGVQAILLRLDEEIRLVLVEAEDGISVEVPSDLLRHI